MKLIVGLGNPGKEYENTRHNVGFMVIDKLLKEFNCDELKSKLGGLYTTTIINDEKIIFLKPMQYINLSGIVVRKYIDYFKINLEDILIINDDLDLKLGTFKLRPSGSSAGHNGLKNIEAELKTNNYKRLKIGISNNKNIDTKDYVLGKIDNKEELEKVIDICPNIILDYLKLPFSLLMSKYNRKQ